MKNLILEALGYFLAGTTFLSVPLLMYIVAVIFFM